LLSTLPLVGTVLFGYWIGLKIQNREDIVSKISSLIPYAVIATIIGVVLHFEGCPINKPIWSSSYVLVTGGLATFWLAGLIFVLDYKNWRSMPFFALPCSAVLVMRIASLQGFKTVSTNKDPVSIFFDSDSKERIFL
jgi:predicted acyltransferase